MHLISLTSIHILQTVQRSRERKKSACVGRMAVSRAERRWSKEPRMVTMLSVIVCVFCIDSLINEARSVRVSIAAACAAISIQFLPPKLDCVSIDHSETP